MKTTTRLMTLDDAETLAKLHRVNRAFLAPWNPVAPEAFFTRAGQRDAITQLLRDHADGVCLPHVIVSRRRVIGRITLSNIIRGALQSAIVGYWLNEADNGRGHATATLGRICAIAFDELGLHRVEAGTLVTNVRSQAVLTRNGFERYGLAPRYLKIAGTWQDHILFQKLAD